MDGGCIDNNTPPTTTTTTTTTEEEAAAASSIKDRFNGLQSSFEGFSEQLDRQKRSHREEIERKIAALKEDIAKTQSVVVLEKRSHAESMRAMQTWLEEQTKALIVRIETPLHAKLDELMVKIHQVDDRVGNLEKKLDVEVARLPPMIDERASALLSEIKAFDGRFEHSASERQRIEEAVIARIEQVDTVIHKKIDEEIQTRALRDGELDEQIGREVDSRHNAVEKVWERIKTDVATIKVDIAKEVKSRTAADNELVAAIQKYATTLKESIRVVAEQQ